MKTRPVVPDELNKHEQATVLLGELDRDRATMVLQELSDRILIRLMSIITSIDGITRAQKQALQPFQTDQGAEKAFKQALQSGFSTSGPLSFLQDESVELIARLLKPETPRNKALVIGWFRGERADELLEQFEPQLRSDLQKRLDNHPPTRKHQLANVSQRLRDRYRARLDPEVTVPAEHLLRFFKALPPVRRLELSTNENCPDGVELFTFTDLSGFERSVIARILKDIDNKTLAVALKRLDEPTREAFLRAVSRGRRETIQDEQHYQGRPTEQRLQENRRAVLSTARELYRRNELPL